MPKAMANAAPNRPASPFAKPTRTGLNDGGWFWGAISVLMTKKPHSPIYNARPISSRTTLSTSSMTVSNVSNELFRSRAEFHSRAVQGAALWHLLDTGTAQALPGLFTKTCSKAESRRPDSNRGPLHYELWAAVTTCHWESLQVTPRAERAGLEVTQGDLR